MHVEEQMLGDFLVDRGLLSRRSIDDALKRAGGAPFYEALQGFGLVDEDELRRAAAHAMGVLFVEFAHHEIEQDALFLIPEPLARAHNILGLRVSELGLEVALLNLTDLEALEPLRLRHRILPRLTSHRSLTRGLLHYQKLLKEKFAAILGRGGDTVEALLHHALLSRAHGVHIDLKTTGTLVRYRIGHALEDAMELPAHIGQALADKLKLLAKLLPASPERQRGEPALRSGQASGTRCMCLQARGQMACLTARQASVLPCTWRASPRGAVALRWSRSASTARHLKTCTLHCWGVRVW